MVTQKIKNIIDEIIKKSKECKDGFLFPEECKLEIAELENFDAALFQELQQIKKTLWSSESNYYNRKEVVSVPILRIEGDYILFYKSVILQFQKEINL